MKYLKLYENIDFDDISEEEFDDNILNNIHIKTGDILSNDQNIEYWNNYGWTENNLFNDDYDDIIDKIELSDNIKVNPYRQFNDKFKKIPNGEIIFSIKNHWPWFRYNKNIKIE